MTIAYDSTFFANVAHDSLRSARVVVPMIMELLMPQSVVDVGCGTGAWLRAFVENGVSEIQGIDGDYIDREKLLIDSQNFVAQDLTESIVLDRSYDLALCIEVAEHLPCTSAAGLVEQLVRAAPAVMFSAAIPGQEGTNHLNEQWLSYWRSRFSEFKFTMIDAVRPQIRDDVRIAFYIRQNLVLFVSDSLLASRPLHCFSSRKDDGCENEWVHIDVYKKWLARATTEPGVKEVLRRFPSAIVRSVVRRMRVRSAPEGEKIDQASIQ